MKAIYFLNLIWIMNIAAANLANSNTPSLTTWQPDGNAQYLNGTRLSNHYTFTYPATDVLACYRLCLNDYANGCAAVSVIFTHGPFTNYCFQYKKSYGSQLDPQWTSIILSTNSTPIGAPVAIALPPNTSSKILYGTRLSNHYVITYPVENVFVCYQLCLNDYESGCVAVSITLNSAQKYCYQYRNGFGARSDPEWTSILIIKNSSHIGSPTFVFLIMSYSLLELYLKFFC
jgi:hypothetical protein